MRGSGEGDRCWLGLGRAGKDRLGAVLLGGRLGAGWAVLVADLGIQKHMY